MAWCEDNDRVMPACLDEAHIDMRETKKLSLEGRYVINVHKR